MKKIKYLDIKIGQKVAYNKKLIEVIDIQHTPVDDWILVRIRFKDGDITVGKGHVELNVE